MKIAPEHEAAEEAWRTKPVFRTVYSALLADVLQQLGGGTVLEIGGGASRLRDIRTDVITSDVLFSPRVDLIADAQCLPFRSGAVDNIVLFDVLHHIPRPVQFLREAERVLSPGGRLVMMEPAITPGSWLFYKFFHPEPFDLKADPLGATPLSSDLPYDSNQAIPTLLAGRYRHRLAEVCPGLELLSVHWLSLFAYPLSGGLRRWSLISSPLAESLLALERRVPQWIARKLAFRMLMVFERKGPGRSGQI